MLYTTITIGNKDYKARLNVKALVDIERKLKTNPLNVIMEMANEKLPSLEVLLTFLQASLTTYNHNIDMDKTYELFDTYCEEGGDLSKFMEEIFVPILSTSGLIPKEHKEEEEKN